MDARTRRAPAKLRDFSATVERVRDGDSLSVRRGAETYELRLARIDAPELHQRHGDEARRYARDKVEGQTVRITARSMDQYGRLIAEVTYHGGRSLNEDLVAAGWAWWYRRLYPGDRQLEALERRARDRRLGVWQDRAPEPPWQWRRKNPR